jgi:hypothetical protein
MSGRVGIGSIISSGLVLKMDAGNSLCYPGTGTSVTDLSTLNTVSTMVGPTFVSFNLGAWVFDGVNDYIRTPTLTGVSTGNFAIDAWVYPTTITGDYRIISCNQTLDNFQLIITPTAGLQIYIGSLAASSSAVFSTNTWYHVAATRSGSSVTLYVNGSSVATGTNSTAISTTYLDVGYRTSNSNHPFNGRISVYGLYNTSLTSAEVSQNFNSLRGRYGV